MLLLLAVFLSDCERCRPCCPSTVPHLPRHPLVGGAQVRRLKSGDVYSGTLVGGRKVGTGVFNFACRDVYTGEFVDDVIDGHGVYNFAQEGTYSGQVGARAAARALFCRPCRPMCILQFITQLSPYPNFIVAFQRMHQ